MPAIVAAASAFLSKPAATEGSKNRMHTRDLLLDAHLYDLPLLLREWSWLLPDDYIPQQISVLGDWVLQAPDGSLWLLSLVEGICSQIAADMDDYRQRCQSLAWINQVFLFEWQISAAEHGLLPDEQQCLAWIRHPLHGGRFQVSNLQVRDMGDYQQAMGQLHRQLQLGTDENGDFF